MNSLIIWGLQKYLTDVNKFLFKLLKNNNINSDLIETITICVDEMVSNIIQHNYKNNKSKKIKISVISNEKEVIIDIYDEGRKFNILNHKLFKNAVKDINLLKSKGFGLFLIKKLTDKVEWEYLKGEGNHFRFRFKNNISNQLKG